MKRTLIIALTGIAVLAAGCRFHSAERRVQPVAVALSIKPNGVFTRVTGAAPADGALFFGTNLNPGCWMPVRRGIFAFNCYTSNSLPASVSFLPLAAVPSSMDYTRGSPRLPLMSVTFDAGDMEEYAEQNLALLKREGIKTTIFLSGKFIERYPNVVREIMAAGHEAGNHTFSHPHLKYEEKTADGKIVERYRLPPKELTLAEKAFQAVTRTAMVPFWRAPYDQHCAEIRAQAWQLGYVHACWSWDSLDWVSDPHDSLFEPPGALWKRYRKLVDGDSKNLYGTILLFHLSAHRTDEIEKIINDVRQRGILLVPLTTLLASQAMNP